MQQRWLGTCIAPMAAVALLALAPVPAQAQDTGAFRTPWGHPDLQGAWTNTTTTPMQRPEEFAGRDRLSAEERAELDAEAIRNSDRPPPPGRDTPVRVWGM